MLNGTPQSQTVTEYKARADRLLKTINRKLKQLSAGTAFVIIAAVLVLTVCRTGGRSASAISERSEMLPPPSDGYEQTA